MSHLVPPSIYNQLAGFAGILGVEGLARAYAISRWLTRPTPGRPRHTPGERGLAWEPCICRTADGLRLVGWVVTPARPRATVALFHGLRGSREELLPYIALFAGAGYRCVAFDHRAHGESDGRRTSFGYHEARDVTAVLDWVDLRWPRQPRVVLGRCLGAAAVCFAGVGRRRPAAVVLESLYPRLESLTFRHVPSETVLWMTGQRLGVCLTDIAPTRHLASVAPAPVLLAAGSQDERMSPAALRRLVDACRGPCELHLAVGAGRADLLACRAPGYRDRLLDFLERHLATARAAA